MNSTQHSAAAAVAVSGVYRWQYTMALVDPASGHGLCAVGRPAAVRVLARRRCERRRTRTQLRAGCLRTSARRSVAADRVLVRFLLSPAEWRAAPRRGTRATASRRRSRALSGWIAFLGAIGYHGVLLGPASAPRLGCRMSLRSPDRPRARSRRSEGRRRRTGGRSASAPSRSCRWRCGSCRCAAALPTFELRTRRSRGSRRRSTRCCCLLLIGTLVYHSLLGVQVVVEDYVHHHGLKIVTLLLLNFAARRARRARRVRRAAHRASAVPA